MTQGRIVDVSEFLIWSGQNQAAFRCPWCGDIRFGSSGLPPNMQRHCHGKHCRFTWHERDDHLYFLTPDGKRFQGGSNDGG